MRYQISLTDLDSGEEPGEEFTRYSQHRNAIWVSHEFFKPARAYEFRCEIHHDERRANGVQNRWQGVISKVYEAKTFPGELAFTVTPQEGVPFDTVFTLEIVKSRGSIHGLKCEFGYWNDQGRVVIPTADTGDYLDQSLGHSSLISFNRRTLTEQLAFPHLMTSGLAQLPQPQDDLEVYC